MPVPTMKWTTKRIRGADGKFRTLFSHNGIDWHLDLKHAERSQRAATNLHGAKQREKIVQQFNTYMGADSSDRPPHPEILPVTTYGSPILGKEKGKNQKFKRNLKRRNEREVQQRAYVPGHAGIGMIPKPVHKHRCHGSFFMCSCEFPFFKRQCGVKFCLKERLKGNLN